MESHSKEKGRPFFCPYTEDNAKEGKGKWHGEKSHGALGPTGSSSFGLDVLRCSTRAGTKASGCKTDDTKKAPVKKRPGSSSYRLCILFMNGTYLNKKSQRTQKHKYTCHPKECSVRFKINNPVHSLLAIFNPHLALPLSQEEYSNGGGWSTLFESLAWPSLIVILHQSSGSWTLWVYTWVIIPKSSPIPVTATPCLLSPSPGNH